MATWSRRAPRHVRAAIGCALYLVAVGCRDLPSSPTSTVTEAEAGAGRWRTWVLSDGAELRPSAPPAEGSAASTRDIDGILAAQRARTGATDIDIARWNSSPSAAWDSTALTLLDFYFPLLPDVRVATPVRAARTMALLHVAIEDALIATWDAKYAYARRAPAALDARVTALRDVAGVPSYPSEHAAAGAAASAILSALFPGEDTLMLRAMADAEGASRVAAGVAYPSDVAAGAAIGRAVAARVLDRARADGSATEWTGTPPAGDGLWVPTPNKFVRQPFDASAGTWRTWVLPQGDAFRPPPPPALGSAAFIRDVAELRALSASRSLAQVVAARYWATDAPSVIWEKYMLNELDRRHPGPVTASRAQALASVAMYDAFIACWDAKFAYWLARPVTTDPSIRTVFPTPPFPSYPSGHSTISTAAAEVFADLFPDAAPYYRDQATEASLSRIYAGVHYRFDVVTGDSLGARVGREIVKRAHADPAIR